MNQSRHDWSTARNRIHQRMAELRLGPVELARASGLSEKHIRTLLNDNDAVPREQTRWALCDALQWTPDSLDRILDGFEPIQVADNSGEISRLDQLDGRLQEIEALVVAGLESDRTQQVEMAKFFRLHEQLKGEVRAAAAQLRGVQTDTRQRLAALETAIEELRRGQRPTDAGPT